MPSRVLSIVLALLQVVTSVGATPFVLDASRAQFRAAALKGDGSRVFLAAYDRDAVWVFDAATREKIAEIVVGDGPAALALSADGKHLLCANRLGNSVSIIDSSTNAVLRTDNVGDAPSAAVALSDGRFAVVSTFADTVTLVDPASPANQRAIDVPGLVPTGIAASADYVGVIGRGAPGALLIAIATPGEPVVANFAGTPSAITGLTDGAFAVATDQGTVRIDASGTTLASSTAAYAALSFSGGALYGLTGSAVVELDAKLDAVGQSTLAEPADLLAYGGGRLVALAPAAKRWQLSGPLEGEMVVAQAAPAAAPMPETTPEAVEEAAAPEEASAPSTEEPTPAPSESAPAAPVSEAPAIETTPKVQVAEAEEPVDQNRRRDRLPWSTAPNVDPGMRPSASPLQRIDKSTVENALIQPTEFGSVEGGFQPPDWREPFKDIKADTMRQELGSDRTTMSGNVNMNMGEMHFRSDEFTYSKEAGQVEASGNVSLDQQSSRLRAGSFSYYLPEQDPAAPAPIFTTSEDEQNFAQQRLAVGHLKAQQVLIEEPTRQLTADDIDFDFGASKGVLQNVRGRGGILYYKADKITITGPETAEADEVWVTTCDHDPPHYRIAHKHAEFRNGTIVEGTHGRLQVGKYNTPLWIPKWKRSPEGSGWNIDFDSGRRAELGPYLNVGLLFDINPDMQLGPRIFATSNEGIGFGGDTYYDFMESPASPLYRSKGEAHGFYTTKERGHFAWYHRYEPLEKLVVRMQAEQWSDESFYKDFFYDDYKNRTEPRTFANATYREDSWIATATVRPNTHNWVRETERLPEATFHLLDRPIAKNLYLSFDTVNGYNNREPSGEGAARSVNVARLTYSLDKVPWLSITPFAELEITGYSKTLDDGNAEGRVGGTIGTTFQSRLQRAYGGRWGFDGFKHLIVPSTTVSYRPGSSLDLEDTPRFDAYDNALGRVRIESKLDNILYGRDAVSGDSWQVGRLSLYQGNDLWNEELVANDYEVEFDVRPRPWWGIQGAAERHEIEDGIDLDAPRGFTTFLLDSYENITGEYFLDQEFGAELNSVFADYNRILTQIYYDDTTIGGRLMGRIGFAYTETEGRSYNRDLLYGMGWKFNDKWFARFEHVLNLEDGDLRQQTYEIRRALHCWELGVRFRDRDAGFDVDFVLGIRAFPGSRINF
jgi:YVTN family beta-propeller protein